MQHSIEMYLLDIQNSIDSINEYLGTERNFNTYESNKLLRRAVERELEIIGEAVSRILKVDSNYPITNARKIVDTRNRISHGYDSVSEDIIWTGGGLGNSAKKAVEGFIDWLTGG